VLILLPPSEGKTGAVEGGPVDLAALCLPELAPARRRVMGKLVAMARRTSARSLADSLRTLGLGAGQVGEVQLNARLATAAAAPAAEVYSGVLYEALGVETLAPAAREWVEQTVVVFSGLWGVVRLSDRIPAYRCSVGVTLPPPVGGLTAYWKKVLRAPLGQLAQASGGPVLDLRSGAYAAMWSPAGTEAGTGAGTEAGTEAKTEAGARAGKAGKAGAGTAKAAGKAGAEAAKAAKGAGVEAAEVRVLQEKMIGGVATRSVVSHFNKATKGRLVRALAEAGVRPATVGEAVAALRDLKFTVEEQPVAAGRPRRLDVIVREL
jgi:uncharacterized protein